VNSHQKWLNWAHLSSTLSLLPWFLKSSKKNGNFKVDFYLKFGHWNHKLMKLSFQPIINVEISSVGKWKIAWWNFDHKSTSKVQYSKRFINHRLEIDVEFWSIFFSNTKRTRKEDQNRCRFGMRSTNWSLNLVFDL